MNPFIFGKSKNNSYFCPRPKEENIIKDRINTAQLIHLTGLPKIGKTSLIKEVSSKSDSHYLIHIDFSLVEDFSDVERRIIAGLMEAENKLLPFDEVLKKYEKYNPSISLDSISKNVEFKIPLRKLVTSIDIADSLKYISRIQRKEPIIVFDNLQEITKIYSGKELCKIFLPKLFNITLFPIILISTLDVFNESNFEIKEFIDTIETIELKDISAQDYENHVSSILNQKTKNINKQLIKELIQIAGPITGDRQQIFYGLWELATDEDFMFKISSKQVLANIYEKYIEYYADTLSELTPIQKKILKLLAKDDKAKIYSKSFITEVGPTANNTIIRTINSLTKRKIIYKDGSYYKYANPFFKEWLKILYS